MGKTGRLYSPEFKEEAIRLVRSSEERYPLAKIARDLDVSAETLRASGSSRPRSTSENVRDSPPRRKKS
jgi:transposase-like protein